MAREVGPANASPTKEFFVSMLTRDIALEDTILDLVDNSLDGVARTLGPLRDPSAVQPFNAFWARIHIDSDWFSIEDNCGGIPLAVAENEAFRMGRPPSDRDKDLGTVGVYGIGMKRALFKIGKEAVVTTWPKNEEEFEVQIPPNWVNDKDNWLFPISSVEKATLAEPGTRIMIVSLNEDTAAAFKNVSFLDKLRKLISRTYALIMRLGFKIIFNDVLLTPTQASIYVAKEKINGISPYALSGSIDGVHVSLACGFYRPLLTEHEMDDEQESRRLPNLAGWTVICNKRVILYQDRSGLTGWGLGGVPNYHNQFIAFCGIVEFESADASKLPLTTTKRGIDVGSSVYLKTREYMMKGTKLFTNFTNKWKGSEPLATELFAQSESVLASDASRIVEPLMRDVPNSHGTLKQLIPALPMPRAAKSTRRIVFTKSVASIERVSELLFGRIESPGVVGDECFEFALKELS